MSLNIKTLRYTIVMLSLISAVQCGEKDFDDMNSDSIQDDYNSYWYLSSMPKHSE